MSTILKKNVVTPQHLLCYLHQWYTLMRMLKVMLQCSVMWQTSWKESTYWNYLSFTRRQQS